MKLKKMYKKMPAILKRTAWAKTLGLIVSLVAFVGIIFTGNYASHGMLAWGILLWYPTVGAMIGLAGVMDKHPLLGKMGAWRGILIGGSMNLLFILIGFSAIESLIADFWLVFAPSVLVFWAILEGMIVGGVIDLIVTRRFGEGKKLLKK